MRWAGIVGAIVGSLVAAPNGTALIARQVAARIRTMWRGLLRRPPAPSPVIRGSATASAAFRVHGEGFVIPDNNTPLEIQARRLWEAIVKLDGKVNRVNQEARARDDALSARVDRDTADLHAAHRTLEDETERERRQEAQVDARALWLIGLGVVMTGVPDGLARWKWIGLLFIAAVALAVIRLALWPISRYAISGIRATLPTAHHRGA